MGEPVDVVCTEQNVGGLGDGQGDPGERLQELRPLSCQLWNTARTAICPASPHSQGWALSSYIPSSVPEGKRQGTVPASLEVAHDCGWGEALRGRKGRRGREIGSWVETFFLLPPDTL